MIPPRQPSLWTRFWHVPIRAESLALFRILLGSALLADQLLQLLPHLDEFFGPHGIAPSGLLDAYMVKVGRWTIWLFNQDDPAIVQPLFAAWVVVTALWTLGQYTRWMNVAVWLLTMCFNNRNVNILNGGDYVMQVGVFLLMLSPCGKALSLDAWLARRRGKLGPGPVLIAPWSVRVMQIQLCLIYLTTGLDKLKGNGWGTFQGTWWNGTSIHNVLNDVTMSRWSFAQLPLPFWLTAALTYSSVGWEVLFTPLVLFRRTRPWALWFGILFHLGIWFTIEIGWFSFYTMSYYAVWVPNTFWERWDGKSRSAV